jgi:hypothetical protein
MINETAMSFFMVSPSACHCFGACGWAFIQHGSFTALCDRPSSSPAVAPYFWLPHHLLVGTKMMPDPISLMARDSATVFATRGAKLHVKQGSKALNERSFGRGVLCTCPAGSR